jgi:RNA polymerase sigma factor (sigma-70 family)
MEPLSDEQREQVASLLPLVKWIARRYPSMGEWDDRVQDGMLGVVRAVRNYRPGRGKFSSFAAVHARGAMHDGYRSRERSRFRAATGHTEVSLEEPLHRRGAAMEGVKVGDTVADGDPTPEEGIAAEHAARALWDDLSPAEKELVAARAVPGGQRRLGELLGLTESRISQRWRIRREGVEEKARRHLR